MADADGIGRVDDAASDTMIQLFVRRSASGVVERATFRTFGCSACIAASSITTELLIGRANACAADEIDSALGGLPEDKRYCAELVAQAVARALGQA
jgi:NifU-like protein involved in Fe-S cluster formation